MRSFITVLCWFFLLSISSGVNAESLDPIVGSWKFNVEQVPWEYSSGNMVFEIQEDEKVAGKMKFVNGAEARILNVKMEEDKIAFDITAEGYTIKLTVTLKGDDLTGIVHTTEGNLPFKAKREVLQD